MPAILRSTRMEESQWKTSSVTAPVTLLMIVQVYPNDPENQMMMTTVMKSTSPKNTKPIFNPLPTSGRKYLSTALGLMFEKVVYYGQPVDLVLPQQTYKTKGDGNCYFRTISYILTGTEENHRLLR